VEKRVRAMAPFTINTFAERTRCAPWGLLGGGDALPNGMCVERGDGRIEQPPNGKLDTVRLNEGDKIVIRTGGGGGFGDPAARSQTALRRDVRCGYVSREAAVRDYGVSTQFFEEDET
jgi:N-methylhydantoinase B